MVRRKEGFAFETILGISLASRERMRQSGVTARAAVEARLPIDTWLPKHFAAVFTKFLRAVAISKQRREQSAAFEAMLDRGRSNGVLEWWSRGEN